MAKFTGAKGKLVRRFGCNIIGTPKFDRLLERRPTPPGQHGSQQRRPKQSEYGKQLIEKQKLRYTYGVLEKQFRRTLEKAQRKPGVSGDNLMQMLESRFDSTVFRAGLGVTRFQARQLINHGHLLVNGRRVNVPSYQLRPGDRVSVRESERSKTLVARCAADCPPSLANWLETDRKELTFNLLRYPLREELDKDINENLIIELYSK